MNSRLFTFNSRISQEPPHPNQKGSIILIVLMMLVLLSIIGIGSTNSTISESFIVRNMGIRKQNIHLADSVASEALQEVLNAGFDSDIDAGLFLTTDDLFPTDTTLIWVHDKDVWETNGNLDDWYDLTFAGRVLDDTNSEAPNSLIDDQNSGAAVVLEDRGEWAINDVSADPDDSPIRYALVGWDVVSGDTEDVSEDKITLAGTIYTEYVSGDYGILRLGIGVKRVFAN